MIPPPRSPVARRIFDALCEETSKRKFKQYADWIRAERMVVLDVVNSERASAGKPLVTEQDVLRAENSASGHVDYMWKYSYYAEELVLA